MFGYRLYHWYIFLTEVSWQFYYHGSLWLVTFVGISIIRFYKPCILIVLNINSENLAFLTANSLLQLLYKNQNAVTYV